MARPGLSSWDSCLAAWAGPQESEGRTLSEYRNPGIPRDLSDLETDTSTEWGIPRLISKDEQSLGGWNFRKDGETTWRIGQSNFTELTGFFYIEELIRKQGVRIDCRELLTITCPELGELPPQNDTGAALDATAIQQIGTRLRELSQKRKEAEEKGDDNTYAKVDKEFKGIEKYLNSARGQGGKPRKTGDLKNRIRDRVATAIRRAFKSITKTEPKVAAHLKESIHLGCHPIYAPRDPVPTWTLS